jgi:hypothetical protein
MRGRFTKVLQRGRYCSRFIVIVEATLADVLRQARELHENAIIASLASWQYNYCPFLFAGTPELAARTAESFLLKQMRDVEKASKTFAKAAA